MPELRGFIENNNAVSVCPEVLGGLPVPRSSCEMKKIGAKISVFGKDYTEARNNIMEGAV